MGKATYEILRPAENLEIITLVEQSSLSVSRTLAELGIPRWTFCIWYDRYLEAGIEGWRIPSRNSKGCGTKSPNEVGDAILDFALKGQSYRPARSPSPLRTRSRRSSRKPVFIGC
jgi:hypothetical protein